VGHSLALSEGDQAIRRLVGLHAQHRRASVSAQLNVLVKVPLHRTLMRSPRSLGPRRGPCQRAPRRPAIRAPVRRRFGASAFELMHTPLERMAAMPSFGGVMLAGGRSGSRSKSG
jgi:hypothetical protein